MNIEISGEYRRSWCTAYNHQLLNIPLKIISKINKIDQPSETHHMARSIESSTSGKSRKSSRSEQIQSKSSKLNPIDRINQLGQMNSIDPIDQISHLFVLHVIVRLITNPPRQKHPLVQRVAPCRRLVDHVSRERRSDFSPQLSVLFCFSHFIRMRFSVSILFSLFIPFPSILQYRFLFSFFFRSVSFTHYCNECLHSVSSRAHLFCG